MSLETPSEREANPNNTLDVVEETETLKEKVEKVGNKMNAALPEEREDLKEKMKGGLYERHIRLSPEEAARVAERRRLQKLLEESRENEEDAA